MRTPISDRKEATTRNQSDMCQGYRAEPGRHGNLMTLACACSLHDSNSVLRASDRGKVEYLGGLNPMGPLLKKSVTEGAVYKRNSKLR